MATDPSTLSLHDALPICLMLLPILTPLLFRPVIRLFGVRPPHSKWALDRKSTRLNSSHLVISYAVFCLKKKQARLSQLVDDLEGLDITGLAVTQVLDDGC